MQFVPFLAEDSTLEIALALTVVISAGNLVALNYWAHAEAKARPGSVIWTVIYLLSGFGQVYYVWVRYVRNNWEPRTEPADRREQLVTAYSLAFLLSFLFSSFVTPPDPGAQIMAFAPLFVVSFVVSYLLITRGSIGSSGEATA